MAGELQLEIVTPSRRVLSTACDEVCIPGEWGEFGVLPEHAPLTSRLSAGVVRIRSGAESKRLAVRGGFAHVLENRVTVLADEAALAEDLSRIQLTEEDVMLDAKLADPALDVAARDELLAEQAWLHARQQLL